MRTIEKAVIAGFFLFVASVIVGSVIAATWDSFVSALRLALG